MKNNRLACAVLAALLSIQTLPASAAKPDTASAVETPSQNNPARRTNGDRPGGYRFGQPGKTETAR